MKKSQPLDLQTCKCSSRDFFRVCLDIKSPSTRNMSIFGTMWSKPNVWRFKRPSPGQPAGFHGIWITGIRNLEKHRCLFFKPNFKPYRYLDVSLEGRIKVISPKISIHISCYNTFTNFPGHPRTTLENELLEPKNKYNS